MDVDRVLLAAPRGFCAGVEMAIKALAWMVREFDPPVYCYHEIVHNQLVVDRFRELGVVFVDDVADVPVGVPLMLSAHGSAPEVVAAARANGGFVVDAVCPLVTKVHHEVKVRAGKGYSIVYVGHEGHDEAVGTMAVAPGAIHLVESDDDVAMLDEISGPVALLAQTTLSHHDWAGVRAVIDRLNPANGVEVVTVTDEDEYFPPPRELRELLSALDTAVRATLAAVPTTTAFADDRQVAASDVLDALAP